MARLNMLNLSGAAAVAAEKLAPRTHEGTPARRLNAEEQLRRSVLACLLWENQFYEDGVEIGGRIRELVPKVKADAVAALAIEARDQMKLRHAPLLLVREMACHASHRALVADTLQHVIQRADELAEFVAIYWSDGRVPLSAQVKKGLAEAFTKFDGYQLAKYNRPGPVKLRDVLFLCHAKPRDLAQEVLWRELVEGRLPPPDTWEVALSAGPGTTEAKRDVFERLLRERKLGALAVLRNLRNMQQAGVSQKLVFAALEQMNTSRVLPFRFVAAARHAPQWEPQLEGAMFRCIADQEKLPGKTALVIDTSPSMWQARLSARSEMDRFEAAAGLAILVREVCEQVAIYAFNEKAYAVPARRGFALRDALALTKGGWSKGGLAVAMANADGYDRIIVLTDGQWHFSGEQDLRAAAAHKPAYNLEATADAPVVSPAPLSKQAYMINVASYKNGVGYGKWTQIDGWSESVLQYVREVERRQFN